ncbi:MAG: hypothetical protein SVO96_08415 [Pseudomonadota bacterium]|nr:hypothetical protein [Pseudomonadota bacterium]
MPLDSNRARTGTDVAARLASVADDCDWRLEISKAGVAKLHDQRSMPASTDHDAALHGDFALPGARRVARLVQSLRDDYPTLKHGPSIFVDR